MQRRRFVSGACTIAGVVGAGCLDQDSETGDTEDRTTPTNSDSPSESDEISPTETVQGYIDAIADGDAEAAKLYVHPDAPLTVDQEDVTETAIQTTELEQRTVREVVEYELAIDSDEQLDNATAERQAELDELAAELELTDTVYVFFDLMYNTERETGHFLLVHDDRWQIWI